MIWLWLKKEVAKKPWCIVQGKECSQNKKKWFSKVFFFFQLNKNPYTDFHGPQESPTVFGSFFTGVVWQQPLQPQATGSRCYERFTGMQIAKIIEEELLGKRKKGLAFILVCFLGGFSRGF